MKLSVIALALLGVLLLAEFSEGHYRRGSRSYRRYGGSRYRSCRSRTTTTTTTTTTTAAPAAPVADPDLTALIDFFTQLLTLDPTLLENLAASLAVTPVDIIPVTVPRLRRREVNGDMYEDPCKGQDHEELKPYLNSPSELRKYIYSTKDCCTVKAALRYLTQDKFEELRVVTDKLLTNRLEEVQNCSQSTETRLQIIDTILGQSGSDDDDIVLQLGQAQMRKRQTRRPRGNPYLKDNLRRLSLIIKNLNAQVTREDAGRIIRYLMNIRSPLNNDSLTSLIPGRTTPTTTTTTTTPAPLSQDFTTLLANVMAPIFGAEASQQLSNVITNLYPNLVNYQQMLANLVQNAQFTDKPATCYIMYNMLFNSNSLGLGQENLIKNVYNLANCTVDDVIDVMNTPAQPTSSSSAAVDNSQSCGISNKLRRTLSVAQSDVLVFNRIMGGSDAGSCEIPWQVRLTILDSQGRGNGLCGGSIISPDYILTAAHCIPSSGSIRVTAGDYDTTETESTEQVRNQIPLSSVTVHPDYDTTNQGVELNDIALIKLDTPLTLTDCVKTVCLKANFDPMGQACTVSGWGTDRSGGNLQNILQVADIPTFNGSQCDKEFSQTDLGNYVGSEANNLCAGYSNVGGIDSCQGDSGGPLVCLDSSTNTMVQAGIVSYGGICGDPDLPGIYTNVASYFDWIAGVIGNN